MRKGIKIGIPLVVIIIGLILFLTINVQYSWINIKYIGFIITLLGLIYLGITLLSGRSKTEEEVIKIENGKKVIEKETILVNADGDKTIEKIIEDVDEDEPIDKEPIEVNHPHTDKLIKEEEVPVEKINLDPSDSTRNEDEALTNHSIEPTAETTNVQNGSHRVEPIIDNTIENRNVNGNNTI